MIIGGSIASPELLTIASSGDKQPCAAILAEPGRKLANDPNAGNFV